MRGSGAPDLQTGYVSQKGSFKRLGLNDRGYNTAKLYKDGQQKGYVVHRLVAVTYLPNPENKLEVNHKNGIKTDNRLVNLEWATSKENHEHGFATGLYAKNIGERHYRSTVRNADIVKMRRMHADGK